MTDTPDIKAAFAGEQANVVHMAKVKADRKAVKADIKKGAKSLMFGSDVEIAQKVAAELEETHGQCVSAEGKIWRYSDTNWEPIDEDDLRLHVHAFDGAMSAVDERHVKLSKGKIGSIRHELGAILTQKDFFATPARGINCESGFIRIDANGEATLEAHSPDHRVRHTLPGHWQADAVSDPPVGSLLHTLIEGSFRDDPDSQQKADLVAEVIGCAALGYSSRLIHPKAVVLWGATAENGKSQFLDLARGLLPEGATCSVPAAKMCDERHLPAMAGKLLNASDELSGATAIASDTFKAAVTGEPIQGREAYQARVEFRSTALNLFATNVLPPFSGGIDRGVKRRLLVVPFNRTVPPEERIEGIGRRVAAEEPDLLLAWAVAGARRLIARGGYPDVSECEEALREWLMQDPALAWIADCVAPTDRSVRLLTRRAYAEFCAWAQREGYREAPLKINGFVQRVKAQGFPGGGRGTVYVDGKPQSGPYFVGLKLIRTVCDFDPV